MAPDQKPDKFREACLAYRAGACSSAPCLKCGPVHQALRIATVALTRWPRTLRKPPQSTR